MLPLTGALVNGVANAIAVVAVIIVDFVVASSPTIVLLCSLLASSMAEPHVAVYVASYPHGSRRMHIGGKR
eukprot:7315638-Lingulodinium_polyedra.AAC.1